MKVETADALIVVDAQNAFLSGPDAVPGHAQIVSRLEWLIAEARAGGTPRVFLQNDGQPGAVDEPFQPGWALFFEPRADEKVIRKTKDDGFAGTDLDAFLTAHGVRTVVVCGVLSEMCVAATARSAMERGYVVVLPHDAHAAYDVPPGPGSEAVPASLAARAAEWSLGDDVRICDQPLRSASFRGRWSDWGG